MMKIILAGNIAIEATHKLIENEKPALSCRFSDRFLYLTDRMTKEISVDKNSIIDAVTEAGYEISEDDICELSDLGIFGGLWDFAENNSCGIEINLGKINIRQETIEIFEYLDVNPYTYPSAGSFLIRSEQAYDVADALNQGGIEASVIGKETETKDRIIINQDEIRYLTPANRLIKDEQNMKNLR